MSKTEVRLGAITKATIYGDGTVGIEQGQYMDSDPDYQRNYVSLDANDMRELVTMWLVMLLQDIPK